MGTRLSSGQGNVKPVKKSGTPTSITSFRDNSPNNHFHYSQMLAMLPQSMWSCLPFDLKDRQFRIVILVHFTSMIYDLRSDSVRPFLFDEVRIQ